MRILVLGGSVFVSRATAAETVARGHEVVTASRGVSGDVPDGVCHVVWDRSDGAPPPTHLADETFDAVVDVARTPSWVRTAVGAFPAARWAFVSTVNVYADDATPGQTPATGTLRESQPDDVPIDGDDPDAYGRMKVACEQLVHDGAGSAFVVRPGLIVGPGDPTGRFTFWPARLDEAAGDGKPVVAPGDPADVVQVVDVRDLATWIVDALEAGTTGVFDAVGEPTPIGELLGAVRDAVAPDVDLPWVPSSFLLEHEVAPWSGEGGVPLWLPRPDYDGMLAHDPTPSIAAGLRLRPIGDTALDTLAWLRGNPDAVRTGWSRRAEIEVLASWIERSG